MPSSNIKVFLRIRPSAAPSKGFSAQLEEGILVFEREKEPVANVSYTVDNSKTVNRFRFDGILPMAISQEDVFTAVAKPVIEDVLAGINGTIFAYGQTGSGKTFTITGGAGKYSDRGLIPRSISFFFQTFQRGGGYSYQLGVSYLEIYNNDGYDLLIDRDARQLEDLPKVRLVEDENGDMHLRNLSIYPVQSEEEALNHLFLGDTNRVVAETPMNDASTRGHCIFIMWCQSTQIGSSNVRKAKLHLVDLAGSERVSKTGVDGQLRKEAININMSLHYLGQVIEALHLRAKGNEAHIPYRNSLMTSVLRDSLGGNCKTVMVGTAAVEEACVDESISTCKFAQRVAAIKNNATINEEMDPSLLIKKLKKDAEALKEELKLLQGGDEGDDLKDADVEECKKLVSEYLEERDPEAPFVCGSGGRFRESFRILREIYWQQGHEDAANGGGYLSISQPSASLSGGNTAMKTLEATVLELRAQVEHRDSEIGMLVTSLKQRSAGSQEPFIKNNGSRAGTNSTGDEAKSSEPPGNAMTNSSSPSHIGSAKAQDVANASALAPSSGNSTLLDRNQAFEVFRKSVRRTESIEEKKEAMLKLAEEARALGEKANAVRSHREQVKLKVEKARMERALECSPRDPDNMVAPQDSPEIVAMLEEMAECKRTYLQHTERLKQVKLEIDKYQQSQAENSQRLQKDFENWFATYAAQKGLQCVPASGSDSSLQRNTSQRSNSLPAAKPSPAPLPQKTTSASCSPTPEPSAPQASEPKASSVRSASYDRPRPSGEAWSSPSSTSEKRRPLSQSSSTAQEQRSPNESRSSVPPRPPSGPNSSRPSPGPTPKATNVTGDAETDKTIAEFYAAMAELGK